MKIIPTVSISLPNETPIQMGSNIHEKPSYIPIPLTNEGRAMRNYSPILFSQPKETHTPSQSN